MSTIYDPSKSTAIAAIKTALASYITTGSDGAPVLKEQELLDWLNGQVDTVIATEATSPAYAQALRASGIGEMRTAVSALASELSADTWKQRSSDWPLTSKPLDKEALLSQLDQLQADALATSHAMIYHAEDKSKAVDTLVADWFSANVLPDYPAGVTRIVDSRVYFVTWVTDWDEESAPSAVTDILDVDQNDTVTITMPTVPVGKNINRWRIYRSATGGESSGMMFLAELSTSTTTYVDSVAVESLGEPCPTQSWLTPPTDLTGLIGLPNGILAGFSNSGRTVCFCEPYAPYAWPVEYQIPIEFEYTGRAVFGQTLVVGTRANPYLITGADSASMSAVKLEFNQACVSKRSMIGVGSGVMYASPDGLCLIDSSGARVVTESKINRADWQALSPSSMLSAEHEGVYYCWYTGSGGGCLTYDLSNGELGTIDLTASAVYVDRLTDFMYVANGTAINQVYGGATKRTGIWKSKLFRLPVHTSFAWIKAVGDVTSPVTVRIYKDGETTPWYTATISDAKPVRMPFGRYQDWQFEIESASRLVSLIIATDTKSLQEVE